MFMSPCIVMCVCGCRVSILLIALCMFVQKSGSLPGRLYMLMIVCIGLFLCLVLCSCVIIVAVFGMCMSSMYVVCKFCFVYIDMSFSCLVSYPSSGYIVWSVASLMYVSVSVMVSGVFVLKSLRCSMRVL